MRIIDLLNKIANGEEEAPKIIRKGNFNFIFNNYSCIDWYYLEEETEKKWLDFMTLGLNDEVEILDEEKKGIEKLDMEFYHDEPALIEDMAHTINLIIDKLNKMEGNNE